MIRVILIVATGVLTGCFVSSQPHVTSAPGAQAYVEPQMVCRSETPTGSMISREICRQATDPNEEFNRDTIQRALETPRANTRGR